MNTLEKMRNKSPQKENIIFRPSAKSAFFKALPACAGSAIFLLFAVKLHPIFIFISLAMVWRAALKYISFRSRSYWINQEWIRIYWGILLGNCLIIKFSSLECLRAKQRLMMIFTDTLDEKTETISREQFEIILNSIPVKDLEIEREW